MALWQIFQTKIDLWLKSSWKLYHKINKPLCNMTQYFWPIDQTCYTKKKQILISDPN